MRSFHFPGRSPVYGRRAMCATSHPAASLRAVEVLREGGNAVDAAIATAAVLAVVESPMTGVGGDCFALLAKPGEPLIALNASGRAPQAATAAWYEKQGIDAIETTSAHAVTVPGAVDGWCRLLQDHGTMPLAQLLQPAIEIAERGFPVSPRVATDWRRAAAKLSGHAGSKQHLLISGAAPRPGQVMRLPALAKTLAAIAEEGRDGFYEGEIATDMAAELAELGGLHTKEDFAAQTSSYVTPISIDYRGMELCELPPSNQGIVALILLKMLEKVGLPKDPNSAERYHIQLEAARLAYAMRDAWLADPDVANGPVAHMLSDGLIDVVIGRIEPKRRMPDVGRLPQPTGSDTVCFSIVDEKGMAISFINSLYADFGSGITTRKTGVTFHNRAQGFVLDPKHPNCIAPRKRPMHTLVPAMLLRDGKPYMPFGVMGAMFQPMGHAYLVTNMIDFGMDPQEAIDAPRVFFDEGGTVLVEESLPKKVVDKLEALGHPIKVREMPWGGAQCVVIDRDHDVLIGASDPRKDGLALGY
jgi:gamma-glutamyltranspeptidase / glutathione hydrolase